MASLAGFVAAFGHVTNERFKLVHCGTKVRLAAARHCQVFVSAALIKSWVGQLGPDFADVATGTFQFTFEYN